MPLDRVRSIAAALGAGTRQRLASPAMIVGGACFLQAFDTSSMAIALPQMARSLGVEALELDLVISAYLVGAIAVLPLGAWLAGRLGARTTFLAAIALFGASAGACALAPGLEFLLAARFVEGCAGALLLPIGRLIVLRSVPADGMVKAIATLTLPVMLGPVLGPAVGGFIVSAGSWRMLFGAMAVTSVLGFILVSRRIGAVDGASRVPFDLRGSILLVAGLGAVSAGLAALGGDRPEKEPLALLLPIGIALVAAYVRHARRRAAPILDLDALASFPVRVSTLSGTFARLPLGAMPFLLALLFQLRFGLSPAEAGLLMLALALGSMTGRGLAAPALSAFGYRVMLVGSSCCVAALIAACALLTAQTPHWIVALLLFAQGALRSAQLIGLTALGYLGLEGRQFPAASTLSSISQQFSQALGITTAVLMARGGVRLGLVAAGEATDFAFPAVAVLSLLSLPWFLKLGRDPGDGAR